MKGDDTKRQRGTRESAKSDPKSVILFTNRGYLSKLTGTSQERLDAPRTIKK
jgi:hypothetical protein